MRAFSPVSVALLGHATRQEILMTKKVDGSSITTVGDDGGGSGRIVFICRLEDVI